MEYGERYQKARLGVLAVIWNISDIAKWPIQVKRKMRQSDNRGTFESRVNEEVVQIGRRYNSIYRNLKRNAEALSSAPVVKKLKIEGYYDVSAHVATQK